MAWVKYFISESDPDRREIILAIASQMPFEAFEHLPEGLNAYIRQENDSPTELTALLEEFGLDSNYSFELIEEENWNAQWESNFQPVTIANTLGIRADFHPPMKTELEVIITPKMSFGTGHHPTTSLVAEFLLENPPKGENVLDVGSGTGILSILASNLGASEVIGIDNDPWCDENFRENIELNSVVNVSSVLGTISDIDSRQFGTVIANINRNVLLDIMPQLSKCCSSGAQLFLSGFYERDKDSLVERANEFGLNLNSVKERSGWLSLRFKKEH